jgi:hypothetical protein
MAFWRWVGTGFVVLVLLGSGIYFVASVGLLVSGRDMISGFFGAILAAMIFGATALLAWWKRKARSGLDRLRREQGFTPQEDVFHVKFDHGQRLLSAPPYRTAISFDDVVKVGMDWHSRATPNPLGGSMTKREAALGIYTSRDDIGVWWVKLPVGEQAAKEAHFRIARILGLEAA